jgi:hypothetical protein
MGVRILFPGEEKKLSKGVPEHTFSKANKKDTIFIKKFKNIQFLAGQGGKSPPPPSKRPCW